MEIIHTKYYKLRKKIIGISIIILFLSIIILKFLLPDYLVKENELKTDTGIIQNAFMNKYLEHERYRGMVYKKCLDVILADKPYYIRFTDQLDEKYWSLIIDNQKFSKTIIIKFQARLLHDNILYNPNEVLINNQVIIPADSKKSFIGWTIFFLIIAICFCTYYLNSFLKLYGNTKIIVN